MTSQNLSILDKAIETYLGGTFNVPLKRQVDREDCDGNNVFVTRQFAYMGAQTLYERILGFRFCNLRVSTKTTNVSLPPDEDDCATKFLHHVDGTTT